jgi:transposase
VRKNLFWLSDEQWERIEPHLPTDVRGVERADDRRVISGIVHVLKSGCRWCDCPPEYGPATTIYNRCRFFSVSSLDLPRSTLWSGTMRAVTACRIGVCASFPAEPGHVGDRLHIAHPGIQCGLVTASQIASASVASFFYRLT